MKRVKVNFNFKSMALVLFALVLSSNVWGAEPVATFNSSEVVSNSTYQAYSNDDWSLSVGGNNISCGFNKTESNAKKIGNSYGTSANKDNYGFVVLSKNKLTNINKITFICTAGSGNSGKAYLASSTDNSTWTALSTKTGTGLSGQGSTIGTANTTYTFEFTTVSTASYFAFIVEKGNSTGVFRFDNTTISFYEAEASSYTVTKTLNNCSVTGTAIPATTTTGFSTTISANSGFQLPSTISVSGASHTWDASTGALTISDVKGNVSITITATAAKTISSIAVTTSPKISYTTCEKLVVSDWIVTATYSDETTSDVTSGCTFSPANGSDLTAGSRTVTVTHTASGKTTTETVTVTQSERDTFKDNVQGTADQYGECNYTIPSCGDKTKGAGCDGEHYKFIGWSSTQYQAGTQTTEPSGLLKAGSKHDATGATYYAVWAAEQE